jgi:hypothetical protein
MLIFLTPAQGEACRLKKGSAGIRSMFSPVIAMRFKSFLCRKYRLRAVF